MKALRGAAALVGALAGTAGCAYADGEVERYPRDLVGASLVERVLAPGALKVSLFEDSRAAGAPTSGVAGAGAAVDDAGRLLGAVGSGYGGAYRIDADGNVARLDLPAELWRARAVVGGVDTAWLVACPDSGVQLVGLGAGDEPELYPGRIELCTRTLGRSRRVGALLWLEAAGANVTVHRWLVREQREEAAVAVPLPLAGASVLLVDERADGEPEVLVSTVDTLARVDGVGGRAAAPWSGSASQAWRLPGDEGFVILGPDTSWHWSGLDGDPPVARPLPEDRWPRQTSGDSALSYPVVTHQGAAVVVQEAPATPCTSRAACLLYGESALVGVHEHPRGVWGVYHFWAWTSLSAYFVAPLDREIR